MNIITMVLKVIFLVVFLTLTFRLKQYNTYEFNFIEFIFAVISFVCFYKINDELIYKIKIKFRKKNKKLIKST